MSHQGTLPAGKHIGHFKDMNHYSVELGISYLVLIIVVTFPNHHQASFLTRVALGNQAFVGLEMIQL